MSDGNAEGKVARAASRVRDLREGAMTTVSDTPGWVWVVLGGVTMLIVGLIAAQRVRSGGSGSEDEG